MSAIASQLHPPAGRAAPARRSTVGRLVVAGLLASSLWVAAASQAIAADPTATVQIDNFTFSPAELSIAAGTTVTWVNHDDIPHLVVDTNKAFRSQPLDTDDSFSFTFTTPGSFDYFCALHPRMTGKIVVTPKAN